MSKNLKVCGARRDIKNVRILVGSHLSTASSLTRSIHFR